MPILDRSQLGEVACSRPVDERVLVDPSDPRSVRAERWIDALREAARYEVQGFEDSTPRPIEICSVFEDDVDEGETEERIASDDVGMWDAEHRRRERVGNLVLDHLGCLA
jgi:hypothetical protein